MYIALLVLCTSGLTSFAQSPVYEDVVDSLQEWVNQRVNNASEGAREVIETPFVVRSTGWGCLCPEHYIGISPYVQDGPWMAALAPADFPVMDSIGHSLVVTGYFTGKYVEIDLRNENGEPEEWLYIVPEFQVLSWSPNEAQYEAAPPRVIRRE